MEGEDLLIMVIVMIVRRVDENVFPLLVKTKRVKKSLHYPLAE